VLYSTVLCDVHHKRECGAFQRLPHPLAERSSMAVSTLCRMGTAFGFFHDANRYSGGNRSGLLRVRRYLLVRLAAFQCPCILRRHLSQRFEANSLSEPIRARVGSPWRPISRCVSSGCSRNSRTSFCNHVCKTPSCRARDPSRQPATITAGKPLVHESPDQAGLFLSAPRARRMPPRA
jgi:hypothetical protein